MAPGRERDKQLAKDYKRAMKEHDARRLEAAKKKQDFNESPPVPQQHITTDSTVEALADVLTWNPRGVLLYRDEATGWVASLNQYKGGKGADKQFWLSTWSCQDYTINRKGKEPLRISRPYVSVIGNIPPDMLGELADRRGRADGFIDRILFTFPDPVQVRWTDKVVDSTLLEAYVKACLRIASLTDGTCTLTAKARVAFADWFNEHNRNMDGPAGSWAKLDGYCARLANILHHLHYAYAESRALKALNSLSAFTVDVQSVEGAIALVDYFKNHTRRALGTMQAKKEGTLFSRLLAFVLNSPNYRVRPRALIAAQIAATAEEAKGLLQRFVSLGLGTMLAGNRKDSVVFEGRPDLEDVSQECEGVNP
jgi:hypothetical protein